MREDVGAACLSSLETSVFVLLLRSDAVSEVADAEAESVSLLLSAGCVVSGVRRRPTKPK